MRAITLCLLAIAAQLALGQTATDKLTLAMNEAVKSSDLPAVVAIAINNKGEQLTYSHGNAVWAEQAPVTPQHIFRIYSMTKMVTSIAAMQLVEKKIINLDQDLSTYLPEMSKIPILEDGQLRPAKNPITLRHLLSHSSGFGYPFTDEQLSQFDRSKWEYKDLPRRFESGTQFLYGTSTDWVGRLIEKITGMSLAKYFQKNITGPLGMKRTFFNVPDSLKPLIVSQGRRGKDELQPLTESNRVPERDVAEYSGGGGLFSTPHDYTILLRAMLNNGTLGKVRILNPSTVQEMKKNQIDDVSMATAGSYYAKGVCCNFNGITSPTTKWGLAWLIDNEDKPYGRKAGTVLWGGLLNTYFYIDYKSGIAVSIYTQHLPFNHPETIRLLDTFSNAVYEIW
jgi:methyl acetate hydrolase